MPTPNLLINKPEFVNNLGTLLRYRANRARMIGSLLHFLSKEVSALNKHYGLRLKMLHCCTDQAISNALAQMDLTAAQGHILGFLSHHKEAPCPRDIEEVFHLSHPTVSGLLNRLMKKDFLELRPDDNDKRCKRIYLLPKGEACNQHMRDVIHGVEQQLVQDFTPEEQEIFIRLLDRAIGNMGGFPRPVTKEACKK